jgi:Fe2+ or Zn2+ uptake regulation protein
MCTGGGHLRHLLNLRTVRNGDKVAVALGGLDRTSVTSAAMSEPLALEDLVEQLRASGARVTSARRLVLRELLAAGDEHLTAEEVTRRIQMTDPEVHVSTVYRTLESVEQAGLVVRAGLGEGPTTYHLAHDRHHHARCDRCGTVIQLPDQAFASVVRRLQQDHGFLAVPKHLTVQGLCATCRTELEPQP